MSITNEDIVVHECPTCGVYFGLEKIYSERRRKDGDRWYCPNGHGQSYTKPKPEIEVLKARVAALETENADLKKQLAAALEAAKAAQMKPLEVLPTAAQAALARLKAGEVGGEVDTITAAIKLLEDA